MPTVLITGANRGIGLEFARQYSASGWSVLATTRSLDDIADLTALGGAALDTKVEIFRYDALDGTTLDTLVHAIEDRPLDVVIANAGSGGGPPCRAADIDRAIWAETIAVNTAAPFLLAARLKQNLASGSAPKLVGISSLAASIGSGYAVPGQYVYRASKAAMNALWRTLSVHWQPLGITCVVMRPGRVKTRMTEFSGDLDVAQSVGGMKQVIDGVTIDDTGKFFGYDGAEVPW